MTAVQGGYPEYVPRPIDLERRREVYDFLWYQHRELADQIMEVLDSNPSAGLPYHGTPHLYVVAFAAQALAWEEQLGSREVRIMFLAALFHDFDHRMEADDTLNVTKAVEAVQERLHFLDQGERDEVARIIEASRYPYLQKPRDIMEAALRDADILFSTIMVPDAQHFRNGLLAERGTPATEQDSLAFVIGHGLETASAARLLNSHMTNKRFSNPREAGGI